MYKRGDVTFTAITSILQEEARRIWLRKRKAENRYDNCLKTYGKEINSKEDAQLSQKKKKISTTGRS